MTRWAKNVAPDNVLPKYPRPNLVRDQWMNLNGLWDFAITSKIHSARMPTSEEQGQNWRYTTKKPPATWRDPAFNDSQWKTGKGAFGTTMTPNIQIGTVWDQPYIYIVLLDRIHQQIPNGLCAAVYTQTSDIETECNGLMTYDREVIKLDIERANDAIRKLYEPARTVFKVLVPASQTKPHKWKYTTAKPAPGWQRNGFNDEDWQTGPGVFGSERIYKNVTIGTAWEEKEIYLRRRFTLKSIPKEFGMRIYHDEDADVYINGNLVARVEGWKERDGYLTALKDIPIGKAEGVLCQGENGLAVYCRQTGGGQSIDVGILEVQG